MTQIKKVPFDYEYFKQHPETKLETRNGKVAYFIGEKKIEYKYPLIFENVSCHNFSTTLNGIYDRPDRDNILDIFMLIEVKEEIRYTNVHDGYYMCGVYNTLEEAIKYHAYGVKSVAKIVIVDGEIDFKKCETVHKY